MTFRTRQVALQFIAREQSDGVGVTVRRTLGTQLLHSLDPFLMLDEFNVGLPAGFPEHPHRGFETVSYLLPTSKGSSLHADFLGNEGELRPGDLQWMTAGRGILHAEVPASSELAHGLQLWVNLPKAHKMTEPRYQDIKRETVPHSFNDDKTIEAIVFAGEAFGQKGPIETAVPMTYVHFIMKKGSTLQYDVPQGHNAFLYTLRGSASISGKKTTAHEVVVFEVEGDGVKVSSDELFEFILFSGEPLHEPVVQHGPFVMNTQDEIREAIYDFQRGTNGFENAPHWKPKIAQRQFQ